MGLNFRKMNRIKVENIELPFDMIECDVDSAEELETLRRGQTLIETKSDLYLISKNGDMAFHYSKPGPPMTMKTEKLELNPITSHVVFSFHRRRCSTLPRNAPSLFSRQMEASTFPQAS